MVTVYTGKNTFALVDAVQRFHEDFVTQHGASVEKFDATEPNSADTVLNAVRSISFLDPKKLVIVRDFSQSKEFMEKLDTICEQTADSCELLLVDQKLDKRTAAAKSLQKNTVYKDFNELPLPELQAWVAGYITEKGARATPRAIAVLLSRVGDNQLMLAQEIDKLVAYNPEITEDSVVAITEATPQSTVFLLLDALFNGDSKSAWDLFKDQRAQGEDPHKVLAMITWQLQQFTSAVFAPNRSADAMVASGISPYSAKKALQATRNLTQSQLGRYVELLMQLDVLSKKSADIESALAVFFSCVAVETRS